MDIEIKEKMPFYNWTVQEARRSGELDLWLERRSAIKACKSRFDTGTPDNASSNYDHTLYPDWLRGVVKEYGITYPTLIMAATIQEADRDRRYDGADRRWAESFRFQAPHSKEIYLTNCHPVMVARTAQMLQEIQKEIEAPARPHRMTI